MLWYNSGWEILHKHEHTAIFNPHALSGFSLFAEIPQKHANYCTDVGNFFLPNYIDIISSVYLFIQMAASCREICVFITRLCQSQTGG